MKLRGAVVRFGVLVVALAALAVGATAAVAAVSDTEGKTTVEQRVVPATNGAYDFLKLGAGEPYTVRQELATAQAGRDARRTSLVYFGQLSDFQLADEESPARLEVIVRRAARRRSGQRPQRRAADRRPALTTPNFGPL